MEKEEQLLFEMSGKKIPEQIIPINGRVYLLRGYGSSNAAVVIGQTSLIMIDALENDAVAMRAKNDLAKISTLPVKTIIYTHTHPDHTSGAGVFAASDAKIIAAPLKSSVYGHSELLNQVMLKRMTMQFGTNLSAEEALSSGLAPMNDIIGNNATLPVSEYISQDISNQIIDGVTFKFFKAVGETDDQMYVYLTDDDILCCGDNYYRSWPNLSAPRGGQYRDISSWIDSLELILKINPQYLISGHSELITGKDNIKNEITPYKEAIEYILINTLKAINKGLSIAEITEEVKLPEKYSILPQLQELYGTVQWAIRGIYSGYIGWFDSNATNLYTMPVKTQAEKRIALAGGADNVLKEINSALALKEYQWTLELCDDLINASQKIIEAKTAKIQALEALAHHQTSANGRHIYFSAAKDLQNEIN